jgi:Pentapeptide repeats (8 copies)
MNGIGGTFALRVKAVLDLTTDRLDHMVIAAGLDPAADLRYGKWRGFDLSGADLRGFDFTGADLTGARFNNAFIAGAIFDHAIYDPTSLRKAADYKEFLRPTTGASLAAPVSEIGISPELSWRWTKRLRAFAGNAGIAELRGRLPPAPDRLAELPLYQARHSISAAVVMLVGSMVLVAGALGLWWITSPSAVPPVASHLGKSIMSAFFRSGEARRDSVAQNIEVGGVIFERTAPAIPRKSTASAPTPRAVAPAAPTVAAAPEPAIKGPVPVLAPPASAGRTRDDDETTALLARIHTHLSNGNLAGALREDSLRAVLRRFLREAAERNDARAALLLGETYDPLFLRALSILGLGADVVEARKWYGRAAELGSAEASLRIEWLAKDLAVVRDADSGTSPQEPAATTK